MPKSSGLNLIKELKTAHPEVEFIVISGYDDFSYAKGARNPSIRISAEAC